MKNWKQIENSEGFTSAVRSLAHIVFFFLFLFHW